MLRCNRMPGLTGNEVRVLVALAYHDGPGGCWPADDTIAAKSGLKHRSAVVTARNGLRQKGRLRWVRGQHQNTYQIAYDRPFRFDSHCPDFPDTNRTELEKNLFPREIGVPATNKQLALLRSRAANAGIQIQQEPTTFTEADALIQTLPLLGERPPRPDARRPNYSEAGADIVFPYIETGPVSYCLDPICEHHPGVSRSEARVRLADLQNQPFDSVDALNETIRTALGDGDPPDG